MNSVLTYSSWKTLVCAHTIWGNTVPYFFTFTKRLWWLNLEIETKLPQNKEGFQSLTIKSYSGKKVFNQLFWICISWLSTFISLINVETGINVEGGQNLQTNKCRGWNKRGGWKNYKCGGWTKYVEGGNFTMKWIIYVQKMNSSN